MSVFVRRITGHEPSNISLFFEGHKRECRGDERRMASGKKAIGVVFFFDGVASQKKGFTLFLEPLLSGPSAYRFSRYLERGQGLVAAPHGVNERGEHPL